MYNEVPTLDQVQPYFVWLVSTVISTTRTENTIQSTE